MKIKEAFGKMKDNVQFKRAETEIMDRKTYYATNILVGAGLGLIVGLVYTILSFISIDLALVTKIIIYTLLAGFVAWNIYINIPLFQDSETALWIKIVRPILGIVAASALMILGIYAFIIALAITIGWYLLKFFYHMAMAPNTSSPAPQPTNDEPRQIKLEDGTILTERYKSSGIYDGPNGTTWRESATENTVTKV